MADSDDVDAHRLVIDLGEATTSGDCPQRSPSPYKPKAVDSSSRKLKRKKHLPGKSHSKKSNESSENGVFTDPNECSQNCDDQPPAKSARSGTHKRMQKRDACTWVRTVSTATEPENLGPCEPGSHVNLDGIVWNESPTGILVVNVTWRGKSYVGTLLDCTRYDWAPPRLCDSPLYEADGSAKTPGKGNRNGKRLAPARVPHSVSTSDLTALRAKNSAAPKGKTPKLSLTIPPPPSVSDEDSQDKTPSIGEPLIEPLSPPLYSCPCRTCDKKFTHTVALKYHQNAVHRKIDPDATNEDSDSQTPDTSTSASDPPKVPSTTEQTDAKLSAIENESLAKLFQVVGKGRRTSQQDLPKLEATGERATSRSPAAYSDISDDGAPVLEKEESQKPLNDQESAKPSNEKTQTSLPPDDLPTTSTKEPKIEPKCEESEVMASASSAVPGAVLPPQAPIIPVSFPMPHSLGFVPPTGSPAAFPGFTMLPLAINGSPVVQPPPRMQELANTPPPKVASGAPPSLAAKELLKPNVSGSDSPVRHVHMHQHTHAFPHFGMLDSYGAVFASQLRQPPA